MTHEMEVDEQELDDVYVAVGAIRAVNRLIKDAVGTDKPHLCVGGAFDAVELIAQGLTASLGRAVRRKDA